MCRAREKCFPNSVSVRIVRDSKRLCIRTGVDDAGAAGHESIALSIHIHGSRDVACMCGIEAGDPLGIDLGLRVGTGDENEREQE